MVLRYILFGLLPVLAASFVVPPLNGLRNVGSTARSVQEKPTAREALKSNATATPVVIELSARLDEERVTSLFAWVSRACAGDEKYNNLMMAFAAIFGNFSIDEEGVEAGMLQKAREQVTSEDQPVGKPVSIEEREANSLGAMGAGQWMGQYQTRPHALLELENFTTVDDWVRSLPRGCRRTIKRALAQNYTVTSRPILDKRPAPHSTLAHFRCVIAHEVRLMAHGGDSFFNALAAGVSRYVTSISMAGEIREYRNEAGRVIAYAQELRKGKTIRGQWFYADDEAAKRYVWFHSVHSVVERAIEAGKSNVTVVDLGPSGSDEYGELKLRYGFKTVEDWPAVADYRGDFWYLDAPRKSSIFSPFRLFI